MLKNIRDILRTDDWWSHIIPPVLLFYFLGTSQTIHHKIEFTELLYFFALLILVASFGFFVGEWSDIHDDHIAGKNNKLNGVSTKFRILILIVILSSVILFCFLLHLSKTQLGLVGIQILAFIFYSVPPFRLKKKPIASIVLDSIYSGTLMYVLAYSFITDFRLNVFILIGSTGILKGLRGYLLHTIHDADNDLKAGIKSLANSIGNNKMLPVLQVILLLEVVAFCVLIFHFQEHKLPIFIIYIVSLLLYAGYVFKNNLSKIKLLDAYNMIYEVFLPFFILCYISTFNPAGIVLIILFSLIFKSWFLWIKRGFWILLLVLLAFIFFTKNDKVENASKIGRSNKSAIVINEHISPDSAISKLDSIEIDKSIVFVIDMWDKHWCKEVNEKQTDLAERINLKLHELRSKGFTIMHIPSDCSAYYQDFEQFKKVKTETKGFTSRQVYNGKELNPLKHDLFLFKALHNGGCNCDPVCKEQNVWTKQHPSIEIQNNDLIVTDPLDIFLYLNNHTFKNIIYMGVHANICLLKRPMGIIKMKEQGYNCLLYKEYTDVMFSTAKVNEMSEEEVRNKIYDLIEYYFCPSIIQL